MQEKNLDTDMLLQKIDALSTKEEAEAFAEQLTTFINDLLQHDFKKLVYLLYRIDVNEKTLKELLKDNPQTDAALIISHLIIQRQQEKIKTKMQFKQEDNIPEEDKW